MKTFSMIKLALGTGNLGKCSFCMRVSFGTMVVSWLGVAGVMVLSTSATVIGAAAFLALIFTSLWLAHILAHAKRSTANGPLENKARRVALRELGKSILGATALSVGAASAVSAADNYPCGQPCSKENDRCPNGCTCWWEWKRCVQLGN